MLFFPYMKYSLIEQKHYQEIQKPTMRSFFTTVLFLCLLQCANARTYYFSASGDDSRSATQAQSQSTPWKSIAKLNAVFSILEPGDVVLFKRGDTFYGTIKPTKSGTSSAPITFGAYGSGDKPNITGFVTLNNWTSIGNGKYEAYHKALPTAINMVAFNGAAQAMGRYPNSSAANGGYLTFESHGSSSIKDNELTSSPSWTGAEMVIRTKHYVIDRTKITAHSGTQLSYSPALSYTPEDGFGYFIQNHIRTLDKLGEWYYNPSTKKITVYFGSNAPSSYSVKASTAGILLDVYNQDNIVVDNLSFTGANDKAVNLYSAANVVIRNTEIALSGIDGVFVSNGKNVKIENSTINGTNNIAITINNSSYTSVKNNVIKNTALLTGMGRSGTNKSTGIKENGDHNLIEANTIENTGFIGINFKGDYVVIKNNFITNFNLIKDDGGGIYTANTSATSDHYGQKIIGNIITKGIGAADGTTYTTGPTSGIYIDDHASGVEISNNTVSKCTKTGIYIHNANKITLRSNTLYDNKTQLTMVHDKASPDDPIRNMVIKNNTFFSKTTSQSVVTIGTILNDISSMGVMDSNYYCRPLDDNYVIKTTYVDAAGDKISRDLDLEGWQQAYKKDLASKRTAAQVLPHKVKALIGSNKFSNGDFASSISGIYPFSSASSFTKSWNSSKLDKGTFQGTASASKTYAYVIPVPVGSVSAGKNYIVKFSMQNTNNSYANVFLRKSASPYTILSNAGVKTVIKVGTARKDYEYAFTPRYSESNTVLFFEVYGQDHTIWVDNIKIYEADVQLTNPDDSIKLVYNASQTSKTVALNGSYIDARNKTYSNAISLAPYASAVLIKKAGTATATAPTVALTSPKANATFAAPASVQLTATASDNDGSVKKVEFYNGNMLLGSDSTSPYSISWNNVKAGSYTLTAKATDNDSLETISESVIFTVYKSNSAPVVSITSPVEDASFAAPASITINAMASDSDGTISKVEFYNGNTLLGSDTLSPYAFTWNNVPEGMYSFTAKAIDDSAEISFSAPVAISVYAETKQDSVSVTPPNVAPVVSITSPKVNATYSAPASVRLTASASDADGTIKKVDFYNGTTLLKTEDTAPYDWTWTNIAAGTYKLTAKATDNSGNITTSAPVSFTVIANVNSAPVVKITSPIINATYSAPASVILSATATDADGTVSKVQFYNGTTLLKTEFTAPYYWTWTNVAAGTYNVTAKATDNNGNVTTSTPVSFTVVGSVTNSAPVVKITSPLLNASYTAPASVRLTVSATDADGTIKKVEYYIGSTLIHTESDAPYDWTWTNVKAGNYKFTAKATDNSGKTTTSTAVSFTVGASSLLNVTDNSLQQASMTAVNKDNPFKYLDFTLFPNPAINKIQVQFVKLQKDQKATLTIADLSGNVYKKMSVNLSGKMFEVDISLLNTGNYVLSLSSGNLVISKAFLKIR